MRSKSQVKKHHILIVSSWYPSEKTPYEGIFVKEQAVALKEEGYQVGVIVPTFRNIISSLKPLRFNFLYYFELDDEIPTYHLHILKLLPFRLVFSERINYLIFRISLYRFMKQYIAQIGMPDLIHGHIILMGGYIAMLVAQILSLPLVVTEHGSSILQFRKSWTPYLTKVTHGAHCLISVSHYFSKIVTGVTGVATEVVPNMVDTDFFTLRPYKVNLDGKRILIIARLNRDKGIHVLLQAFSAAYKGNKNISLDIGGSGEQEVHLKQMVRSLGIEGQVRFLGQLSGEQVRDSMHNADVLVLTSISVEYSGGILVEAMATGLPIIATRSGAPQEIISNDHLGLLVSHVNVLELKNALVTTLSAIENKKYDPKFIRDYVIHNFSKKVFVSKLNEIYTRILSNK